MLIEFHRPSLMQIAPSQDVLSFHSVPFIHLTIFFSPLFGLFHLFYILHDIRPFSVLPLTLARCSIAIAACMQIVVVRVSFQTFQSLQHLLRIFYCCKFKTMYCPFGFSSVYKSECLSEPSRLSFFLGILGASNILYCSNASFDYEF